MTVYNKKVCLLGDFAVGKTSLIRRFVHSIFDDAYISTIGVKVSRKTVTVAGTSGMTDLALLLWDLAGSEEFSHVRSSYLRGAAGAVLVCDLTRPDSLDRMRGYAAELHRVSPDVRLVLAANKRDLGEQRRITGDALREVSQALHAPYRLTSAKTGEDVEALFLDLGRLLVT